MSVLELEARTQDAFHLKSGLFQLLHLHVLEPLLPVLWAQLDRKIDQAPKFFTHAAIVVDLTALPDPALLSVVDLLAGLRARHMVPVSVRGANSAQHLEALDHGLALMGESAKGPNSTQQATPASPGPSQHAQVIQHPVRSGQRIEAPEGDLIVMAAVGHGAELLAAGHIHVYGPLRGRALAGMNGDTRARLFCQRLEAELVSIAGHYLSSDALKNACWQQPTCVALQGNRLQFSKLCDTR